MARGLEYGETPSAALVTGGNHGIGRAICERLATSGHRVAIGYYEDEDEAKSLADRLSQGGSRCVAVYGDVSIAESVDSMVSTACAVLDGPMSILVNNAGAARHTPFLDMTDEEWEWIIQVHLMGAVRCARQVVPAMLKRGSGTIVNMVSQLALIGQPGLAHYVSAKSGVIGLTKTLAREYAPKIRVNAVAPGPTDTRILSDRERTAEFARGIPLGRLGRPEEIAALVDLLCSPHGEWYTGQVISPNGGTVI